MPLISTIGAASSRGFGEFNQQAGQNYIEDYFSNYVYTGNGATQTISNGIGLADTAGWNGYKLKLGAGVGYGVDVDSSGNFYVSGTSNDGSQYWLIAKYNSFGVLQWQRKVSLGTTSRGNAIKVDSSGNVYAIGTVRVSTTPVIILLKYNSSGVLQWQRRLNQGASEGYGLAIAPSGNIYISGYATGATWPYLIVAKYDSTGAIQWQRSLSYGGTYVYNFGKIDIDSSENVYVTGYHNASNIRAIIAKYDSSGTIQWQRDFYQSGVSTYGYSTATDSSGNVYVVGYHNAAFLAKYNTSGTLQWQRRFSSGAIAEFNDICLDSSGNIYVCGVIDQSGGVTVGLVAKYDSSGALQWQRTATQTTARFYGIKIFNNDTLYVTGNGNDGANYVVTITLKASGTTTGGTAFLTLSIGTGTDAAGTSTSGTNGATEAAGGATDTAGAANDAVGAAVSSTESQSTVVNGAGLVWIKGRSATTAHALYDTVRGAGNQLSSNSANAQTSQSTGLTSFTPSGFNIGSLATLNTSAAAYISWTFRKTPKFFDVLTYTGTGSNLWVNHSLGSVPGLIIIRRYANDGYNWYVYHRSLPISDCLFLDSTASATSGLNPWANTQPTATQFRVGTNNNVNEAGALYVAYLFAHDAGGFGPDGTQSVVSCGSYTGNGSATGPVINLGWEPQFVLVKQSGSSGVDWVIVDSVRGIVTSTSNASPYLAPNTTAVESNVVGLGLNATGFAPQSNSSLFNQNGVTYVYMAIRRGPMRVPTDATKVFVPTVYTGDNLDNRLVNTTIAPDMVWIRQRDSSSVSGMVVGDRLRGQPYLLTGSANAEANDLDSFDAQLVGATEYGTAFTSMNGVWVGNDASSQLNFSTLANNQIVEAFKRAPGFFDVFCYTGNAGQTGVPSSNQVISHNLSVAPELIIIKNRSGSTNWPVWKSSSIGAFNLTDSFFATTTNYITNVGATTITVNNPGNTNYDCNTSGSNYVAYLFASCPGVSKVGSYTGTGTTQQINCGFTAGARFVLIKRTDATGDWFVYDSARGIVAGNDPYLRLNSVGAEVTTTDYVDTYSLGFELSSTAPAGLNEAPAVTWNLGSAPVSSNFRGATYGNGLFVICGTGGNIFTSTTGIGTNWTSRTSGFGSDTVQTVKSVNNIFIAAGDNSRLSTSSDGITWTARTTGFGGAIYGVTYGNGVYVIVGSGGRVRTSTDGITWTSQTSGVAVDLNDVDYGNGVFVAGGSSGTIITSPDGVTWTARTSNAGTSSVLGVKYLNNVFLATCSGGVLVTSTDGITWTSRTTGTAQFLYDSAYGNNTYVIVGANGNLLTSTNLVTWTSQTSGFATDTIWGSVFGAGTFVIVGGTNVTASNVTPTYLYLAIA